jgi:hypothetical protein
VIVYVVWDHHDYYGPHPLGTDFLFASLDAAKVAVEAAERKSAEGTYGEAHPPEWKEWDDGSWELGPFYSIDAVEVAE